MRAVLLLSFYILQLMILSRCPAISAWRSFKIIYTKFDFEANSKIVDVKIQVQNNSESTSLDIVVNVLEVVDTVNISAGLALQNDQGNYTTLINKNMNLCKLIKDRGSDPLVRVIYQDMMKYGKIFKECPIQKGTYSLHEYHIDEELLPSFLPENNFKFSLSLHKSKTERIFQGDLYGRIDKSKGFNNLKMFSLG